jgi:hypothetical protein
MKGYRFITGGLADVRNRSMKCGKQLPSEVSRGRSNELRVGLEWVEPYSETANECYQKSP